jgi:hypothetical protein
MEEEAGCFVLLTNVPTAGNLAHSAREILTVYKEQHGTEQNYGFLKDPVIVNSLFLKKPERIEALGLVLLLALLLWRLMERQMRAHVESTGMPLPGWDKKTTERPTAFMMMTKFAGVLVCKVGPARPLARPLSAVQQQYLVALGGRRPVSHSPQANRGPGGLPHVSHSFRNGSSAGGLPRSSVPQAYAPGYTWVPLDNIPLCYHRHALLFACITAIEQVDCLGRQLL